MLPYSPTGVTIPLVQREQINAGILNLIRSGATPDRRKVFCGYTGKGGLHGLRYQDFGSRYEYSEAKRAIEQGQFFTPDHVVQVIARFLAVGAGDRVADLTCGAGAFVNHFGTARFFGLELDPDAVTVAQYLYPKADIVNGDLRAWTPGSKFEYVVGNPPFALRWSVPNCPMANQAGEAASEDVFLWKAADALSTGGTLCFVAPASWLSDDLLSAKALSFIESRFVRVAEVLLPTNAFAAVGVDAFATKIVLLRAWLPKEERIATKPVTIDGRHLDSPTLLAEWASACLDYAVFRGQLGGQRAAIAFADQQIGRVQRANTEAEFYRFLRLAAELRRQSEAAAQSISDQWAEANAPAKYDDKGNRLPQLTRAQVLRNLRKALRSITHPERPLVGIVRSPHGIKVQSYSRAAALAVTDARFFASNDEIATGVWTIDRVERAIDLVRAAVSDRNRRRRKNSETAPPVAFETINVRRTIARIQRRFALWSRPLESDAPELPALRTRLQSYYERFAANGIVVKSKQIDQLARLTAKPGAFCGWEMGCGKSLAALAWDDVKRSDDMRAGRMGANGWTLLVSSALALELHWQEQLSTYGIHWQRPEQRSAWKNLETSASSGQRVVLAAHHQIIKHAKAIRDLVRVGVIRSLIIDEADEFGSRESRRTRAVLVAGQKVRHKLLLTGTPVRNKASELFSQLDLLFNGDPFFRCVAQTQLIYDKKRGDFVEESNTQLGQAYRGRGGYALFKRCHSPARPTVMGADRPLAALPNRTDLEEFLNCFRSRLRLSELIEHQPFTREAVSITLSGAERQLYAEMEKSALQMAKAHLAASISDRRSTLLSLAHAIRILQQTTSIPGKFGFVGEAAKHAAIVQQIRQSSASHIAIGVIWREAIDRLRPILEREFPDRLVVAFDGEDSFAKRRSMLEMLQAAPGAILLCTQGSVRSSLNLPCVSEVIAESLPWNFTALNQWAARFARLTSKSTVRLTVLVTERTIEERILGLLLRKECVARPIAGDDLDEDTLFVEYGIDAGALDDLAQYLAERDPNLRVKAA